MPQPFNLIIRVTSLLMVAGLVACSDTTEEAQQPKSVLDSAILYSMCQENSAPHAEKQLQHTRTTLVYPTESTLRHSIVDDGQTQRVSIPVDAVTDGVAIPFRIFCEYDIASNALTPLTDFISEADYQAKQAAVSQPANQEWYQGGTLQTQNALAWQQATEHNKLASCAEMIAILHNNKSFNATVMAAISTPTAYKGYAEECRTALNEAFAPADTSAENEKLYTNQKVSETFVLLMTMMGWSK